jgi:hypothetical protein
LATCSDDGYCGKLTDTAYQKRMYSAGIADTYKWNLLGNWSLEELKAIYKAGRDIQTYVDKLTGGNGLDWMQHYLGETNISHPTDSTPSWVPRNRDSAMPGLVSGTGANTVYLMDGWLKQMGGSRELVHEMGHIWDTNTGIVLYGVEYGVADQLNKAMGGNIRSNPFACRYCDWSGSANNYPFKGISDMGGPSYGNNSTADYFAETFALSIYPESIDPVPAPAQSWMNLRIQNETMGLIFPRGFQYSIEN